MGRRPPAVRARADRARPAGSRLRPLGFLALDQAPHAALDNLARLRSHFAIYGAGGFYDAVNVDSGAVARFYLALDQGMAMAGAVNALTGDALQKLFAPTIEERVRPLLAMEQFGAG